MPKTNIIPFNSGIENTIPEPLEEKIEPVEVSEPVEVVEEPKKKKKEPFLKVLREEEIYLDCAVPEMSGNYTLFIYGDGFLTAYNEDAKVEHYLNESDFNTKFLKQNDVQQLEPVLHQQNPVG
jgi:hypothetical protein